MVIGSIKWSNETSVGKRKQLKFTKFSYWAINMRVIHHIPEREKIYLNYFAVYNLIYNKHYYTSMKNVYLFTILCNVKIIIIITLIRIRPSFKSHLLSQQSNLGYHPEKHIKT